MMCCIQLLIVCLLLLQARPRIIYASRTHSQLAQVIRELKATAYGAEGRVRMAILGSRQQMCVHPIVQKATSSSHQNNMCRSYTIKHACSFYEGLNEFKTSNPDLSKQPHDIEDLMNELGGSDASKRACPYFLSRDMATTADIIFVPYNYLIDPYIRGSLGQSLQLAGSVLIFDEAHNLESVCGESASFDLTATTLSSCISELNRCVKLACDHNDSTSYGDHGPAEQPTTELTEDLGRLKAVIFELEQLFEGVELKTNEDGLRCTTLPGTAIFELLNKVNIQWETKDLVFELIEKALRVFFRDTTGGDGSGSAITNRKACALDTFATSLRVSAHHFSFANDEHCFLMQNLMKLLCVQALFRGNQNEALATSRYYKVFIHEVMPERKGRAAAGGGGGGGGGGGYKPRVNAAFAGKSGGGGGGGGDSSSAAAAASGGGLGKVDRTVSYWCFSPGVAMKSLVTSQHIRNVLLTSGTLSPMDSFAYELQIPFQVQLENRHVIQPNQVWVGVVDKGPSGIKLNSSFKSQQQGSGGGVNKYFDELGSSIVNFARLVPDGMLVFYPSYGALHSCIDYWQKPPPLTGPGGQLPSVWERISKLKFPITEPRGGGPKEFQSAMDEFDRKLRDPQYKGAVFFAVMRGKVSEGMDFSDGAGRAVVITGIPFPMVKDPKVKLKREYLNASETKQMSMESGLRPVSGNDWYTQQAARAINQAVGRVIRHRADYGAILLCDERFGQTAQKQQLSLWLRNSVQNFTYVGSNALVSPGSALARIHLTSDFD